MMQNGCAAMGEEDFRKIVIYNEIDQEGKRKRVVVNPTSYEKIGKGRQGNVFKISAEHCVKIYLKTEDAESESRALKAVEGSPFFPVMFEQGPNYIVMEYVEGISLDDYLMGSSSMPMVITREILAMLKEMRRLKLTRLDAKLRHIIVTPSGKLKVIDHVNSFIKKYDKPIFILEGLESLGLKQEFLKQVKKLDEALYRKWNSY